MRAAMQLWQPMHCATTNLSCTLECDRLIKWVQAAYPAGGHQAQLRPLLERCTRELLQHEHYKQDLRYLRVWLQYVGARCWQPCLYLCQSCARPPPMS